MIRWWWQCALKKGKIIYLYCPLHSHPFLFLKSQTALFFIYFLKLFTAVLGFFSVRLTSGTFWWRILAYKGDRKNNLENKTLTQICGVCCFTVTYFSWIIWGFGSSLIYWPSLKTHQKSSYPGKRTLLHCGAGIEQNKEPASLCCNAALKLTPVLTWNYCSSCGRSDLSWLVYFEI